jgi:hypothetical protein
MKQTAWWAGWVGVEDGGRDMGTVDRFQLRGRKEVEVMLHVYFHIVEGRSA